MSLPPSLPPSLLHLKTSPYNYPSLPPSLLPSFIPKTHLTTIPPSLPPSLPSSQVGAHPEAQLGLASVSGKEGEREGWRGEGLTQALMAHNQRPAHVYGKILLAQKLLWVAR